MCDHLCVHGSHACAHETSLQNERLSYQTESFRQNLDWIVMCGTIIVKGIFFYDFISFYFYSTRAPSSLEARE